VHRRVRYLSTEGGIGLLDIKVRNEAIDLTWLRDYLNLSGGRPKWAKIADTLFNRARVNPTRGSERDTYINPFLQTWVTSTHHTKKLPNDLVRLVKAGERHGI
ncbi:hypothetical protein K466DRAFT_441473, partial [Polyporus arcularius HHB13444]